MSQVIAILLLMLFFIPACLSILFASRSPLMILWNFAWYYLIAQLGSLATQNSNGAFLGIFFGFLYVLRIFSTTNKTFPQSSFVFKNFSSARRQSPEPEFFEADTPPKTNSSKKPQVTLDAEFEHR